MLARLSSFRTSRPGRLAGPFFLSLSLATLAYPQNPSNDLTPMNMWLLTTKAPLLDSNGDVTGIAGVGHDITARKKVELEWQRAKKPLRPPVAPRVNSWPI